jgi:MFS family permease
MTVTEPAEPGQVRPAALSRGGLHRVLVVLCVTEITSWGVLYYAFPVLSTAIAADTGWSVGTLTAAFSLSLLVSAVVGIPVGRLLDRVGPRPVMTTGSVIAVVAVVGIALAPSVWWFFTAWTLAGVAMAGVLYAPAFAALTRWWGPRRVTALTALTLLAGLASTIFAPLTAVLDASLGWRGAYLVLAAVLASITVPAHLFGLRGGWPSAGVDDAVGSTDDPSAVARSRAFLVLVAAVGLGSFAAFAVVINQVPLLIERGLSTTTAAWALGLGGLGQVLGRLGYARLAAVTTVRGRSVLILAAGAVATILLALLPGPAALLIGIAMLAGATRGLLTLLQATAVSDRWGTRHYGRLNGLLTAPAALAAALAPWIGAVLAGVWGGYPAVFVLLALVAAAAAALVLGATPPTQPVDPSTSRRHP